MEILKTRDYEQFKTITSNRDVNRLHVKKLSESIKQKNLLWAKPPLVNEKNQLIDGQHRLEACQLIGADFFYIVAEAGKKEGNANNLASAIAGIKLRTKRAAELDEEKVYMRVLDELKKNKILKEKTSSRPLVIDKVLLRWILMQHAGYDNGYVSGFGRGGSAVAQIKALEKISDKEFIQIARKIMLKQYSGQAYTSHLPAGHILIELASELGIPVKDFIKEQGELRKKREERAQERIDKLRSDAKSGKKPKVPKAKIEKESDIEENDYSEED
jgi:ParB-like nuclease domain